MIFFAAIVLGFMLGAFVAFAIACLSVVSLKRHEQDEPGPHGPGPL